MFQLPYTFIRNAILVMATAIAMLFAASAYAEEKPALEEDPTFSEWVCTYKVSDLVKVYGEKTGDFLKRTINKFKWSKPKELAFSGYGPHSDILPIYRFSRIYPEYALKNNSKTENSTNTSKYSNLIDKLKRLGSKAKDLVSKARIPRSTGFVIILPKAIKSATVIKIGTTSIIVIVTGVAGQELYCYFTEDSDEETPE